VVTVSAKGAVRIEVRGERNVTTGVTRRSFLAATAAAAVSVPRAAAAWDRVDGANETIQIGVIGMGRRGVELARELTARTESQRCRIVAVSDIYAPHKDRARALGRVNIYHDWQDLVARDDIDAVVIATPDHWHAPMAITAMEAGKDVYCEAPMTRTLEEATAFRDTAAATNRVVQVGARRTSQGQWYAAREVIAAGNLGHLNWCQSSYRPGEAARRSSAPGPVNAPDLDWQAFQGNTPQRPFDPHRFLAWRAYWDYSGGMATDLLYDKLAPLIMIGGVDLPERVSAAGGVYVRDGREVPDTFVMTCEYTSGLKIVLAASMTQARGLPAVVRGREATLYLDGRTVVAEAEYAHRDIFEARFGTATRVTIPAPRRKEHLDNWLDAIRSRRRCACDAELAYRTMVAVGMGVEAYRRRQTLAFDRNSGRAVPSSTRRLRSSEINRA
jgi:predicted dehydrogenase